MRYYYNVIYVLLKIMCNSITHTHKYVFDLVGKPIKSRIISVGGVNTLNNIMKSDVYIFAIAVY